MLFRLGLPDVPFSCLPEVCSVSTCGKTWVGPGKPTPWARFLCWVYAIKEFFPVRIPHWKEESAALLFSGICQSFIGVHVFFFLIKENLQFAEKLYHKLHILFWSHLRVSCPPEAPSPLTTSLHSLQVRTLPCWVLATAITPNPEVGMRWPHIQVSPGVPGFPLE